MGNSYFVRSHQVPLLWVTDGYGFRREQKKWGLYFLSRYVPHGGKKISYKFIQDGTNQQWPGLSIVGNMNTFVLVLEVGTAVTVGGGSVGGSGGGGGGGGSDGGGDGKISTAWDLHST